MNSWQMDVGMGCEFSDVQNVTACAILVCVHSQPVETATISMFARFVYVC